MNKFYLTTAIPYVNAPPHLGHALEFVQADVIARYRSLKGDEVYLTTGADENALKNVRAAEKEGVPVQELIDRNAKLFGDFASKLNVRYDGFGRGSDQKNHWPGVVELWKRCEARGDIYKKSYDGLYCVGHEAFLTEKDLVNGLCPDHQTKPELVAEENYFFRLSRYQKKLEELIGSGDYRIIPDSRQKEVLNFIKGGLEDFSVSRSNDRAKNWGVPCPGDPSQRIYVWFDALGIYLTTIGFGTNKGKFEKWWPADVHVIGKDIIRFHAVYWPAILFSADLPLPKTLFVHGFVNSGGQKMSKTVGNVIDPEDYIKEFGADALRYFLLAEIPATEDGDFTRDKFITRYNADLANGLGNLAARILTLGEGFDSSGLEVDGNLKSLIDGTWGEYNAEFSLSSSHPFNTNGAIRKVWDLIHSIDEFIQTKKPWESKDKKVIYSLLYSLGNIAFLVRPFLPDTSDRIFAGLGVSPSDTVWVFKPKKIQPLFPRFEVH
ncbi:MAG TPA: methionine--tRNA ligase [Candidatus Paceibacterota bacterium]|nr:methionine--tRNA ligase [Candidatus Paceibacterota bacterium]